VTGEPVDVAVVGLGALGSAAAYWCARRGARVAGFEQFDLGHERGASGDHSRIIRLSYHTPAYVELAKQAYDAWDAVERDAAVGEQLVVRTGGVDLFPAGAAIDATAYRDAMDAAGVPYDVLDGREVRRRWPVFAVADDVVALHQEQSGLVAAARANRALQRGAVAHGAALHAPAEVIALEDSGDGVVVVTPEGAVRARHAIVAADAWANRLLEPLGVTLPLTVLREQLTYFASDRLDAFAPERFPVWIWMDDPSFYGFPRFGEAAVKAAEDCGGTEVDPSTRTFDPDPAMLARLREFVDRTFVPGVLGDPVITKTCLYTLTPDRDFVLDRLPGVPQVSVALGAAHGFKFASWFGRTLADLALDGGTTVAIEPFALDRPALHAAPGDRRGWLV
jgi:sarcosine oxidase